MRQCAEMEAVLTKKQRQTLAELAQQQHQGGGSTAAAGPAVHVAQQVRESSASESEAPACEEQTGGKRKSVEGEQQADKAARKASGKAAKDKVLRLLALLVQKYRY
jgi:hypothetical protein